MVNVHFQLENVYMCVYTHILMYMHVCIHVCMHIFTFYLFCTCVGIRWSVHASAAWMWSPGDNFLEFFLPTVQAQGFEVLLSVLTACFASLPSVPNHWPKESYFK